MDSNDNNKLETSEILSTRYVCNGTNGVDGSDGADGKTATIQMTDFNGPLGSCMTGGVKVEVLIDGVVQEGQTQYICNVRMNCLTDNGCRETMYCDQTTFMCEDKKLSGVSCTQPNECLSGVCTANTCHGTMVCNGIAIDSKSDSANCGSCENVCNVGMQCVDYNCIAITDLSTAIITCNDKTVTVYNDENNCGGCGIACGSDDYCRAGVCVPFPEVGDIITFGHYEQDNDTTNGNEPIDWRVLDKNDAGQYLLISEKVLDMKPYNLTTISSTWEKSTIRSWLNGYDASYNTVGTDFTSSNFIDTAFTAEEKAKIVLSNVPAHANPNNSTSPGNATTDKIFLLSITEAKNYFATDAKRQADATRYAAKQGVWVLGSESGTASKDGTCTDIHCYALWWLRSPGSSANSAVLVHCEGWLDSDFVSFTGRGVRPALWVNLNL